MHAGSADESSGPNAERAADEAVVAQVLAFNADRDADLVQLKYERMADSAFAFFRGTDHLFVAAWPTIQPDDPGPPVLICGDLHLENFGAMRGGDGVFRFEINDFDEAVIGPCSFDLVRCAASVLLAAEEWKLSAIPATTILWAFLSNYRQAVAETARTGRAGEITILAAEGAIKKLLGPVALSSQKELLAERTKFKDGKRRIDRNDKHPAINDDLRAMVKQAVNSFGAAQNAADFYHVLDVTGRVAGIGSLGLPRYTVLVAGGGSDDNRLLDLKLEQVSAVCRLPTARRPNFGHNEAERVVLAQSAMQACPPQPLAAVQIAQHWYRLRELIPDENRAGLDNLAHKPEKLRSAVELAGRLTAWSHGRGAAAANADTARLASWTASPALEGVIPAAIRCAARTKRQYEEFRDAYEAKGSKLRRD